MKKIYEPPKAVIKSFSSDAEIMVKLISSTVQSKFNFYKTSDILSKSTEVSNF